MLPSKLTWQEPTHPALGSARPYSEGCSSVMAFRWTGVPCATSFFGKVGRSLYSITALFWRREARRLVLSGRSQQRICFRESDSLCSIPWPPAVCVVGTSQQHPAWYILMFETVVQRSLSKTHVISNHGAKLESKCAVYLRSQKKFWKNWLFCDFCDWIEVFLPVFVRCSSKQRI